MKVVNHIKIYEENGKELAIGDVRHIKVVSHWNRERTMVVIEVGEDMAVTVSARDLQRAVNNATVS